MVSDKECEQAIRTILKYIGDNPDRPGLIETPSRVRKKFKEIFSGYNIDPKLTLSKTFSDIDTYTDPILLKNISFYSFCEHHVMPIEGIVNIAYLPTDHVIGIGKIARMIDIVTKKLQMQERMTAELGNCFQEHTNVQGVAILVKAHHHCMSKRGSLKENSSMITTYSTGCFKEDKELRRSIFNDLSPENNS